MRRLHRAPRIGASHPAWGAAGLAAIAGARMFLAPALVARRRIGRGGGRLFGLLAIAEAVGDKLPGVPSRTSPLPLIGRAASGAAVAIAAGPRSGSRSAASLAWGAGLGAAAALASAFATLQLRLRLTRALGDGPSGNALAGAVEELALGALGITLAGSADDLGVAGR